MTSAHGEDSGDEGPLYDLRSFGLSDLTRLSATLRRITGPTMVEVAQSIVGHLCERFVDKATGEPSCVLARLYKTHRLGDLEADDQTYARERLPASAGSSDDVRCLTLMATSGLEPEWRDRRCSQNHRAIPLPTLASVRAAPMIDGLFRELGFDAAEVVGARLNAAPGQQPFRVFHVPDAAGSPLVPAQDFVATYGVRSVLGFGGLLPDGELYAVILFSRTPIAEAVAEHFQPIAMSTTLALIPVSLRAFTKDRDVPLPPDLAGWRGAALEQLIEVREQAVLHQSLRLEQALADLEDRADELARSRETLVASEARKGAILESSLDAVITMDIAGHIIEFNPAAERMFGFSRDEAIGALVSQTVVPRRLRQSHIEGLARYLESGEPRILGERIEITAVRSSGEEFPVELTVNRVQLSGAPTFTAFIRDISGAKRREAELAELNQTLQLSLLPPGTPRIPGLDVDASYQTALGELVIGGDFYDVFRLDGDTWGVVIGDVCGKGAPAASLTALARYAIRSAAFHRADPAETLREVNAVIAGDSTVGDRFCTAAYARVVVGHDPASATVQLSTAGHPSPAVLRAGGEVEWMGTAAMPLGMFDELTATTDEVVLGPGDALVLFTDGLVEAHERGGELYGEQRLAAVLTQVAGSPAKGIISRVVGSVRQYVTTPSDDLAMLVLRVPVPPPSTVERARFSH